MQYQDIALLGRRVRENIEKVVVGRTETVEMLLAAMLAGGHVLLEERRKNKKKRPRPGVWRAEEVEQSEGK